MKRRQSSHIIRLTLLLLVITIAALTLVSCGGAVAGKSEISENIEESLEKDKKNYTYVYDYLYDWGIKNVNSAKFTWAERMYRDNYAYAGGLPSPLIHAEKCAKDFLENYYDVIDLEDRAAVTDALLTCYADAVDDPYSIYRAPELFDQFSQDMSGTFGGIGVIVHQDYIENTILISEVVADGPADKAGLLAGDYIWGVNGKTVTEIGIENVVNLIRGKVGTSVDVQVKRGEEIISYNIKREIVKDVSVTYEMLEENIGYIRIASFKGNTFAQFVEAVDSLEAAGARGIIFDLRLNTGGLLDAVCPMVSYIAPSGQVIVSYQDKGEPMTVSKSYDDVHPTKKDADGKPLVEDHKLEIPAVVLCNEYTASAAEIFTAAIRDYRNDGLITAKIVGTTTYKKGIMQKSFPYYLDGSSVTFTTAYYNPPCGENYHGIGITPDVEVHNTETEDLQYSRAIEEMKLLINANND